MIEDITKRYVFQLNLLHDDDTIGQKFFREYISSVWDS